MSPCLRSFSSFENLGQEGKFVAWRAMTVKSGIKGGQSLREWKVTEGLTFYIMPFHITPFSQQSSRMTIMPTYNSGNWLKQVQTQVIPSPSPVHRPTEHGGDRKPGVLPAISSRTLKTHANCLFLPEYIRVCFNTKITFLVSFQIQQTHTCILWLCELRNHNSLF